MKRWYALITLLCVCSFLAGCGGKDFDYVDARDTKPGPGLMSGDDGVFTIYGSKKKKPVTEGSDSPEKESVTEQR